MIDENLRPKRYVITINKYFFFGLVLLIVLSFLAIIIRPVRSLFEEKLTLISRNQPFHEENLANKYSISILYPEFTSLTNKSIELELNRLIKNKIDQKINTFKSTHQTPPPREICQQLIKCQSELKIDYKLIQMNSKIISIEFDTFIYNVGGAHPSDEVDVFNYSLKQKKELTIGELFKKDSNYLTSLSEISSQQLISILNLNTKADVNWVKTGTAPNDNNFKNFLIDKDNLIIIFNQYQVASYSEGIQRVTIPYSDLRKILINF